MAKNPAIRNRIIMIANQKGGTGKTTTALNISAALARFHNRRVMLLDADPQGSLTIHVGIRPERLTYQLASVLQQTKLFNQSLVNVSPGISILPSHPSLDDLVQKDSIRKNLRVKLRSILVKASKKFDYVIIDCPPTLGVITFQAMCVADAVLIPLQCEFIALRGVQLLFRAIAKAQKKCNPKLKILGILPTMFDRRTLHSREVFEEIKVGLKNQVPVFSTIIYKSIRFPESSVARCSIFDYAPEIPGGIAYRKLTEEILRYGQKKS